MTQISTKIARLTIASSALTSSSFTLPIWLLFGTDVLGYSITQITVLAMSVWITAGILEIPAGALADKFSRRRAYILGVLLLSLQPLPYIIGAPFWVLLTCNILAGIGQALQSGTLEAITYQAYQQDKRPDREYHTFVSNKFTVLFISRVIASICGGLMYAAMPDLPYIAMIGVYAIMLIIGILIPHIPLDGPTTKTHEYIRITVRRMAKQPIIMATLAIMMLQGLIIEAAWTGYQPFFTDDGINPQIMGILFAVIALCSAIGAYSVRFLMRSWGVMKIGLLNAICGTVTAVILICPVEWLRLIAVIPAGVASGMSLIPITTTVQKHITKTYHTTALSIISSVQLIIYVVGSLTIGMAFDAFGVSTVRSLLLGCAVISLAGASIVYVRQRVHDEILSAP